jgi:hypothetical protein
MDDNFRKELEKIINSHGGFSPAAIDREIGKLTEKYNNAARNDLDGLSPEQMHGLLYANFGENIIKLKDTKGLDIPLIKQISYYLNIINTDKEIKLTKVGNLPPVLVKEIYAQKFISDRDIEIGITKLVKETDSMSVELTNILCQHGGLIKKRNGKISLTELGKKILTTENFLPVILTTFCSKFRWAYFDEYDDDRIGQFGCYYSIYLLNKYGDEKRESVFYADKYLKTLFEFEYRRVDYNLRRQYILRTFDKFMRYFGFLENYEENKLITRYVKKTELFDKYIEVK